MEQRNVVVTAIVLALILAGILWYTLSQDSAQNEATATPTPTTIVGEQNIVPPAQNYENLPETLPEANPAPDVQPTAASGPTENVIAIMVLAMLVGTAGLAYHAISTRS